MQTQDEYNKLFEKWQGMIGLKTSKFIHLGNDFCLVVEPNNVGIFHVHKIILEPVEETQWNWVLDYQCNHSSCQAKMNKKQKLIAKLYKVKT